MGDLATARDLAAPSDSLGRYRLLGVLGQGNLATFHLGIAGGLGTFKKLVVVKELRPELAGESRSVEAFLAEAKLAARLNHPNVVHALEADSDGGRPFLALEFLDGQSLREAWRRNLETGGVSFAAQVRILCEALTGLHHAHQLCDYDGRELQVVHGDVRPENVFVTYDGQVKVMNFGGARPQAQLAYAAPEQLRGRPSDRRTDVFAVGVMLWELLAGKPFTADPADPAAIKARLFGLEPRITQVVPRAPHGLANICNRAMSVDPADRFSTAEDFRDALLGFLRASGEAIDARKTGVQMRALFGPERAAMHRIIESALNLDEEPASAPSTSDVVTPVQRDAATVASVPPLTFALEPDEGDDTEDVPNFRSRRPAVIAALGATALAAAGGFWFGMSPVGNGQTGTSASAPPGVASTTVVPRAAEPVATAAPQPEPGAAPASVQSADPASVQSADPAPVQSAAPAPVQSAVPSPAPSTSAQVPRPRSKAKEEDEPTPPSEPAPPSVSPDNPYEGE
jgi:serine/threonine-protein kinase